MHDKNWFRQSSRSTVVTSHTMTSKIKTQTGNPRSARGWGGDWSLSAMGIASGEIRSSMNLCLYIKTCGNNVYSRNWTSFMELTRIEWQHEDTCDAECSLPSPDAKDILHTCGGWSRGEKQRPERWLGEKIKWGLDKKRKKVVPRYSKSSSIIFKP